MEQLTTALIVFGLAFATFVFTLVVLLGLKGTCTGRCDASRERLAKMLLDAYPDARYNAAVALSRQGDVRAIETLTEMLDPYNKESTRYEEAESQEWKRQDVMLQAPRAERLGTVGQGNHPGTRQGRRVSGIPRNRMFRR